MLCVLYSLHCAVHTLTCREAGCNVVLHVLVIPEPVVDVALREYTTLLDHDPRIQELQHKDTERAAFYKNMLLGTAVVKKLS